MKILDKVEGENVRNYAFRTILDNIVTLELPPGSAVSENELSDSLHISRTPVREALLEMRRLELVESFPQKGSYVTKIDYNLIDDASFIRMSLEVSIVRYACRKGVSDQYLKKMRENLEQQKMYEQSDSSHFVMLELDNAFHRLLFESVQKLQVHEFMQMQMVHFDRLRNLEFLLLKKAKNKRTVADHENIVYAIEKRDEELAEMVMSRHLSRHLGEKEELTRLCPEYFR
ncbi:MAG: GntR family transcriptional regulator [Clostridium sp.]|nr:GntR family transcriptional regulator [Clostridium sp.]MDY5485031.1 GntR family transcriptional regulator [Clostridium sp.]